MDKLNNAALDLFGVVLDSPGKLSFLHEYGLLVAPSAGGNLRTINQWASDKTLSGIQVNSTFHKSWNKVKTASGMRLRLEQTLHYFSTYGLEALKIQSGFVYLPQEELDLPEPVCVKVIEGVKRHELFERVWTMLSSGIALTQETIILLADILELGDYQFTGEEAIANREAKIILACRFGPQLLSGGDDLFRYIYYMATGGKSLVINCPDTRERIETCRFNLPALSEQDLVALSESFNRRKPFYMAMRKNANNRPIINRISRLSKVHHKPMPVDVLGSLTHERFTQKEIKEAAQKATTFRLIRVVNALQYYCGQHSERVYRIRSGKTHVQEKPPVDVNHVGFMDDAMGTLLEVVQSRTMGKTFYQPDCIAYAAPTSEKDFCGNIPNGSKVTIPYEEGKHILVGVYWENGSLGRVDLDLSGRAIGGNIGWNASHRSSDRKFMYSGDVTDAPNGAAEYLYCESLDEPYLVMLNAYTRQSDIPFKIIAGYGDTPNRQYIIDPANILFQTDMVMSSMQMTLGLIFPEEEGISFTLINLGSGNAAVASMSEQARISLKYYINANNSRWMLSGVLEATSEPKDADFDLSLAKIGKDTIIDAVTTTVS